jgi:hypothetical protein
LKPRPAQLVLLGVLGAAVLGACDSELALILAGKRCRLDRDPPCLGGYACIDGFCRVPGEVVLVPQDGGVGGGASSSDGGEATGGGVGGTPALGGAGSQGGTGPIIDIPDASIFLDGGPDGCVPLDLYRDVDGDSYGDTAQHAFGCIREGWVEAFGDCRDDIFEVHPNQTDTFGTGYPDPGKAEGISFDYDCLGGETADINNSPNAGEPNCQGLSLALCTGRGYQSTTRSGDGVNPLCGSDTLINCGADTQTGLTCVPHGDPVLTPFKCR